MEEHACLKRRLASLAAMDEMMTLSPTSTLPVRVFLAKQPMIGITSSTESVVKEAISSIERDRRGSRIGRIKRKLRNRCTWIDEYLSDKAIYSSGDFRNTFGVTVPMFR